MYWLRRALGFDSAERSEESISDLPRLTENDEFPDDPTTDTVPKPKRVDSETE